ncbi:M20 family metallopeptidase [Vagococcus carniphilus]|uniref:M20 family metallopeptidase n=1 Tax=Vagococcus carniphilus TaxID=218144 RepID=UPI00288E14D1|nr:M20 family metallopeptidase [Vagococcus carniphilus]MDT2831741.1 M20 family metallopeptidase [Vagococcus carniphilus]MDT2840594.1 M20 family metallopeptidase [Vagococcus carniphilus]MDT2855252.1 M20 family metallopeptidase [Vagococcus carniphilus]
MLKQIETLIESKKDTYFDLSDRIWDIAETKFHEQESAKTIISILEQEGFNIETNIAEIDTAFIASYGSTGPIIGFLGEYDALPELNQKAGLTKKESDPSLGTTNGHGCGHNLLGTASLAAAIATRDYIKEHNIEAQIRYYGCPAEEGGSGKTYMTRAHAFDDLDMALCWHPGTDNAIIGSPTLANIQAVFEFKGKSSHAANSPDMGRSALDAMELMNVGANYLREHVTSEARYHYAILDGGGMQPSVVQAHSKVLYLIRAPKGYQVKEIYDRLSKIAEGASLMTETEVTVHFDKACSNYMPNKVYSKLMSDAMFEVGAPNFDEEDLAFAKELHDSLTEEEKKFMMVPPVTPIEKQVLGANQGKVLADYIYPYNEALTNVTMPGSTDVGDVSWVVPTAQCIMATEVQNTALHSWQWVANGKTNIAKKGMLQAAKVMSLTALKAIEEPGYIEAAKAELETVVKQTPYINPIPADVKPNSLGL